jgi:tetratricopeptide (TPR) repeat protein
MTRVRINWQLIIVLILAILAVAVTGFSLRKYHRQQRAEVGLEDGLAAYEAGDWKRAASNLGRYLAIYREDVDVLIKYAQSQLQIQPFKRENLEQAINAYRVVLRLEDNEQAAREIIRLYLQFGMPAEAELIARRFAQKSDDAAFRQSLAEALVGQRKYAESAEILNEVIRLNPGHIRAYGLMGEITEKSPGLSAIEAGGWFDRAVEANPDSPQAYILRSSYQTQHNQADAAMSDLERAEQCDLSAVDDRLSLAAAWMQHGRYEKALAHLETVKAVEPGREELWYLWAKLASERGDRREMIRIAEDGLAVLGEKNFTFLPLAAELLVQAGELDRARVYVTALNEADAERGTILYLEGLIAKVSIDWATAIQKWQRAIQLGFSSEMIYLNLADTLDQINNRPMAIQLLRRYLNQSEGSFKGHLQLAGLFAQDRYWQQAMEQATAAVQLNPISPEARVMYLRCQIEMADTGKAVEADILKRSIEQLIETRDTFENRMLMFHLAIRFNDPGWAEEVIGQIETRHGGNEQILVSKARILMMQERLEDCLALLEEHLDQYPDSSEMVKLLAWGYSRDGQFDRSQLLLETAIENSNDPINQRKYRLWLAEIRLLEGNREEAVRLYREMAERNTSDLYVRRQLLSLLQESEKSDQLQQWVNEIKSAEGEEGWQWKYEQARLWFQAENRFRQRYEQIVKLLNENLSLNPDDQASRILLALTHERAGNLQLALSLYHDAMAKQANNLDLVVAAVGLMYRAEEYQQAQALLSRVAEDGVWDPRLAQYELQDSLRIGREDNAMIVLEKMVSRSPDDVDAKLSLALLQIRNNNFSDAEKSIREVFAAHPDSVAAAAALVELYVKQEKLEEALAVCERFLAEHDTLQAHAMRGEIFMKMGDAAGVIEEIEHIQSGFATDKDAQLLVSRLYLSIGETEKSSEIMDSLLLEYRDDFAVQKQGALLYAGRDDVAGRNRGKELLEQALEKSPHDVALRLKKASLLIQENNTTAFQEATVILNKLVKELPRLEDAWNALGQLALIERKPAQAMDYALRGLYYLPNSKPLLLLKAQAESARSPLSAISTLRLLQQEDPRNQSVILMLSQNYRKAGRRQEAKILLEENLAGNLTNSADLKRELMSVLYEVGEKEKAQTLYRELMVETNDGRVLLSWLDLLSREKLPSEIAAVYQEWVDIHPESEEDVVGAVVGILIGMDHADKRKIAIQLVNATLAKNPKSAEGCYAMAMFYHLTGRKEDAITWYEKTIQLNPQHIIAMNNLAWILCTEIGEHRKALDIAQKGLELRGSYVDLLDTRGVIYMHLGEYDKAAADFARCEQMYFDVNPSKTTSIFRRGKCLMLLGEEREALVELYKAKDMDAANGGLNSEELAELEQMIQTITQKAAS